MAGPIFYQTPHMTLESVILVLIQLFKDLFYEDNKYSYNLGLECLAIIHTKLKKKTKKTQAVAEAVPNSDEAKF